MMIIEAVKGGVSNVTGYAQLLASAIKKRQYNKMDVPMEDAEQRSFLDELNMKRKQLEAGAGAQTQLGMGLVGRGLAQTQQNMAGAAGGNSGAAIQGMAMAQRQAGDAANQVLAQGQEQAGFYTQMANNLLGKIAERKFGLQVANRLQKLRESMELRAQGMSNVQSALARMGGQGGLTGQGGSTGQGGETPGLQDALANVSMGSYDYVPGE